MRFSLALLTAGAVVAPACATAATTTRSLAVASAVTRSDCATTRLAGAPGTTTTTFAAPADGAYTFALHGGEASDWDLAVFKSDTHRRMAGSGAFGADELVQLLLRAGERVDVQACRISGAATQTLAITGVRLALNPLGTPAPTASLVHIFPSAQGGLPALMALEDRGFNLDEEPAADGVDAVIDSPAQLALLDRLGLRHRLLVADLAAQDRRDRATDRAASAAPRAAADALPSGRTEYRHIEDTQADLKKLVQDYPAIVRPVTLPKKTFQGRDQVGVEISSNVNATDDQKPISLIVGQHHAREWPAGEIPVEFAIYLAKGYGSDAQITTLLNKTRIVIVPVVNVDGTIASRDAPIDPADQSGDPAGGGTLVEGVANGGNLAYRRKNCDGALPPVAPCELQFGIDPNRNYGFKWGGKGASTTVDSQSYRGAGPWSEPETQSVHEYSQLHDVTSLLTMHNYASLVLRPPGLHDDGTAPDEAALKALGDAMGADTGYTSQYGYQLYDTSGTTEDWNYGAAGTFGYTIEMGPASGDGGGFHIDYQRGVIDQWNGTERRKGRGLRQALLRIANAATDPAQFATIAGRAPAGRILRVRKTFQTSTSPVCAVAQPLPVTAPDPVGGETDCLQPGAVQLIDDKLEYTTTVPANGVFSWLVTPSTRPFARKKGESESWTLTCEDGTGKVYETKTVTIWRGETQRFDLPCGGTLPSGSGPDRLAPRSAFTRRALRATRRSLQLGGTSADLAPSGTAPRLAKVEVAIARRIGRRCRFLRADGSFTAATSCGRPSWMTAHGTTTWTLIVRHVLPHGRYVARVRGVDAAGNRERTTAENTTTFRIT